MQRFHFLNPKTIEEACSTLLKGEGVRPVAGGTDVIPRMVSGGFAVQELMDLSGLAGLRFIRAEGSQIVLGALATHTDLVQSPLLAECAPVLVQAARTVGAHQTRNRGTLGGNIANASPAGDTLGALLVLDAQVTLISASGERTLPLEGLLLGPGKTGIRPDELIAQIRFERLPAGARGSYQKLGKRNGMAIAVASAAVALLQDAGGVVQDVRLALGSMAPTPIRCRAVEDALRGKVLSDDCIQTAAQLAMQASAPISDIRSTAEYRREAAGILVQQALRAAM